MRGCCAHGNHYGGAVSCSRSRRKIRCNRARDRLGSPSKAASYPTVEVRTMQVAPDPATLLAVAEAVQKGALSIPLGERFSLKDAAKAHSAAEKGVAGKILLLV